MTRGIRVGRLLARIEFNPQDLWVGAYWQRKGYLVDVSVCLIPTVPIHFWFLRKAALDGDVAAAHARLAPTAARVFQRHRRMLNRLDSHLGCVVWRAPLSGGMCAVCDG